MKFPVLLLALGVLAALPDLSGEDYQPRNTQMPGEEPPSPREALARFTVPGGFRMQLFAGEPDVRQPVAMAFDDRGRIWVAESYSYKEWEQKAGDRIIILDDRDGDGQFDERVVFWTGGDHLSGMVPGWGGVWVCDAPNLLFIPDRDRDDVPDGEPEVVLDGWTTRAGHNFFNGLTWGIDGWLYGRHGITRPSLVGNPGTPDDERIGLDCSIWRYHPVTARFEVVCRGTTNPWGMDWNAEGELFFTNNVNGHLWHAVPGAFYPRMGNRDDPFAERVYERIGMCADHLHHAGSTDDWTKSRDGAGVHGDLGGGHSHCGAMIYQGDNWPEAYRGRIFMCNTHGRRLNQNILERNGSGYVGRRAPDLFFANQPWFRGVTVMSGPDGGVFVSDWCDDGECHDNDGVHRSSGRIYKITFGETTPYAGPHLHAMKPAQLAELQLHPNAWFARQARHLLQYRTTRGEDTGGAVIRLKQILQEDPTVSHRLRALWTLYAMDVTGEIFEVALLGDANEHVRKWAVRLLTDQGEPSRETAAILIGHAAEETSPIVRLYLASALRRFPTGKRWELATALVGAAGEDAFDPNIPLMIWYGLKDHVAADPESALAWLRAHDWPHIHRYTARAICEEAPTAGNLSLLLSTVGSDTASHRALLSGMLEGLQGRSDLPALEGWAGIEQSLMEWGHGGRATRLGLLLAREGTVPKVMAAVRDGSTEALEMLVEARAPGMEDLLVASLDNERLRKTALLHLREIRHESTVPRILALYPDLAPEERKWAIEALINSKAGANALLDAIARGTIPRNALTAFHARQIDSMRDDPLKRKLRGTWGKLKASGQEKRDLIKGYLNQFTTDVLAEADLPKGAAHYQQRCSVCHTLSGKGGHLGPSLDGANRGDVFYLLESIIDPNAILPQDYHVTTVTIADGQIATGNVAGENDYTLRLVSPAGEIVIDKSDITRRERSPVSLMPEGLLNGLSMPEIRDLIGYLQQAEP